MRLFTKMLKESCLTTPSSQLEQVLHPPFIQPTHIRTPSNQTRRTRHNIELKIPTDSRAKLQWKRRHVTPRWSQLIYQLLNQLTLPENSLQLEQQAWKKMNMMVGSQKKSVLGKMSKFTLLSKT